jgi:rhodanese-related sulfurtransferase
MTRLSPLHLSVLCFACLCLLCSSAWSAVSDTPRISKEKLKTMLNDPRLIIIDTRVKQQWDKSEYKLPKALHQNPWEADEWAKDFPRDRTVVSYCA